MDDFDSFWQHPANYLRKRSKIKCKQKWEVFKKKKILPPLPEIIKALEKQKRYHQYHKTEERFIKHTLTWINQGCWEDECELPQKPNKIKQSHRSPLDDMEIAFKYLVRGDKAGFEAFCDRVNMPADDIEAVKFRMLTSWRKGCLNKT